MKIQNLCIAIAMTIGTIAAGSSAYAKGDSTQDFVKKAASANQFEIAVSKLALEKAQNDNVREFAKRMIDEHSKANEDLENAVQSAKTDVEVPEELDTKHQKMLDKLESASNESFDTQYISLQKTAHKETVDLFSNYSKQGKDPALKEFAAQTLPALKEHQMHVKDLTVQ
jgi:putative membrane protein